MANWQRTLDIKSEWNAASDDEITVQTLAGVVATRLRELTPFREEHIEQQRIDLADEFESFSTDFGADKDDFDYLMGALYDWGDTRLDGHWNGKKVCWIKAAI